MLPQALGERRRRDYVAPQGPLVGSRAWSSIDWTSAEVEPVGDLSTRLIGEPGRGGEGGQMEPSDPGERERTAADMTH